MKLYYSPGACSLADHIALHEAGLSFEHEKVDLKAKKTESGADFTAINPKGYVPALTLDSGETLSENIAILDWITQQAPQLAPGGAMGRTHLLEMLAYISTEIHKSFKPFFAGASDEDKAKAGAMITRRMDYLAERLGGDYLFGADVSVADAYLFVMTLWAGKMGVSIPDKVAALRDRMMARAAVRTAMTHEGLLQAMPA
jgi:glutathione S-transferase